MHKVYWRHRSVTDVLHEIEEALGKDVVSKLQDDLDETETGLVVAQHCFLGPHLLRIAVEYSSGSVETEKRVSLEIVLFYSLGKTTARFSFRRPTMDSFDWKIGLVHEKVLPCKGHPVAALRWMIKTLGLRNGATQNTGNDCAIESIGRLVQLVRASIPPRGDDALPRRKRRR